MSETTKFLEDIKSDETKIDVFEEPFVPVDVDGGIAKENEQDNREARRAKKALREERAASAQVAKNLADATERLTRIDEVRKVSENPSEALKAIEKIYGNATPETAAATELLKSAFAGMKQEARDEALAVFREEKVKQEKEVESEVQNIQTMLEDLEDEYDIDLTSTQAETTRKGFLATLEKLSPKDRDGEIIAFADPHAAWEVYNNRPRRTENRAKDIADRSMSQSVSSESKTRENSDLRWLRENGII